MLIRSTAKSTINRDDNTQSVEGIIDICPFTRKNTLCKSIKDFTYPRCLRMNNEYSSVQSDTNNKRLTRNNSSNFTSLYLIRNYSRQNYITLSCESIIDDFQ